MGLISKTTDLKSLRFGHDRVHGGNSGQPYIQTSIPSGETSVLPSQDFVLRGGLYAVRDSAEDVFRLGKYFTDVRNPSGLLFVAKQNLLSRLAVRTQASGLLNEGIYTPLSTLAEAGGVAFGLHVNKQGLNPFSGPGSLRTYSDVLNPQLGSAFSIISIDKNRLVDLYAKHQKGYSLSTDIDVMTYTGGPGSILGIGSTNIKFAKGNAGAPLRTNDVYAIDNLGGIGYSFTEKKDEYYNHFKFPTAASDKYKKLTNEIDQKGFRPLEWYINKNGVRNYAEGNGVGSVYSLVFNSETKKEEFRTALDPQAQSIGGAYVYTQNELINGKNTSDPNTSNGLQDFRKIIKNRIKSSPLDVAAAKTILSNSPNYSKKNIEQRVNLGDPGNKNGKNLTSYVSGAGTSNNHLGAASISGSTSYDKINALPLYQSETVDAANSREYANDLVKFRIGVVDNNTKSGESPLKTYIHFRAFLNGISDGYAAEWNATKYIGRGENLYTYAGFDRKVSLSWTVAAQSKAELIPMYKKLNYLASICAPDYSPVGGYMRGNIVTLTVGGYFYEQPGIITGFSYEMNDDNSTWEIGIGDDPDAGGVGNFDNSVKELPHMIKVTGFNFIPIHNFVPSKQINSYDKDGNIIENGGYGPERYIALNNKNATNESNYGEIFKQ